MKKGFLAFFFVLTSSLIFLWNNRQTSYTVVIDAPIDAVWSYVSDSGNAKHWSVYFSHISPLPGIQDGQVGSLRRCFRRADETGPTWDEEVLEVTPPSYRQIRTFNLQNFPEKASREVQFRVHQHFEAIDASKTKLSFATELIGPWTWEVLTEGFKARAETLRIFKLNLENIKAIVEGRARLHPYEP